MFSYYPCFYFKLPSASLDSTHHPNARISRNSCGPELDIFCIFVPASCNGCGFR